MKIRNGFVSNSSSSSFVVDLRNDMDRSFPRLITVEQEKGLLSLGFGYSWIRHTSLVEGNVKHQSKSNTKVPNMIYHHDINSEDIVEELVKLGVPFKMLYNYDTTLHLWKPWKRNLVSFTNLGNAYEMGYLIEPYSHYTKLEPMYLESLASMLDVTTWEWLNTKEETMERFLGLDWS